MKAWFARCGRKASPGVASFQPPGLGRNTKPARIYLSCAAAACPHTLLCGDTPDLAPGDFGEPDVAIRSRRDARRSALGRGDTERGEEACGGDAPDDIPIEFREPQVASRPAQATMPMRSAARRGRKSGLFMCLAPLCMMLLMGIIRTLPRQGRGCSTDASGPSLPHRSIRERVTLRIENRRDHDFLMSALPLRGGILI